MTLKNKRVFELKLGKLGLTLFIGGMSVLLFSLFLLGVVVGKYMEAYPERFSTGIPEMISSRLFTALPQVAETAPPEMEQVKQEELPDGEADAVSAGVSGPSEDKKETVVPEVPLATASGKAPEAATGQTVATGSPVRPSSVTASGGAGTTNRPAPAAGEEGTTIKKAVPVPEAKPAGDPAAKKPPVAETATPRKGRYEIQAVAYREKGQAEQLAKKFTDWGFPSQVVSKEVPGKGQWFRVIVGGFENREKAQEAADQLTGKVRGLKCVIRASAKNGNGG
ncbi:MAG: SPOR domain-containing protein [Deltaproteobacteria bacterium]|nr:SPOR domain-containing protein [Deltaproteobacteria bacterium]